MSKNLKKLLISDALWKICFASSVTGKKVHNILFNSKAPERNELFVPGRMVSGYLPALREREMHL